MKLPITKMCLLPAAMLFAQTSMASFSYSYTFNDPCNNCSPYTSTGAPLYYGGDGPAATGPSPGTPNPGIPSAGGDVIGQLPGGDSEFQFDILSLTASQIGTDLVVGINTRFVENTSQGLSSILYGDLMISTGGYSPYGGSSPYPLDTAGNSSTVWNYVVDTHLPGQTFTGQINAGLPAVTQATGIYLNPTLQLSDFAPHEALLRSNQYVARAAGTGTQQPGTALVRLEGQYLPDDNGLPLAQGTLLTYTIPLASLNLNGTDPYQIALRWTMTCANDIVEASYAVPEPATLSMFFGGLAALGAFARKNRRSAKDGQVAN